MNIKLRLSFETLFNSVLPKSRKPEPVPEIKFRKQQGNSNINFIILNRYDYTKYGEFPRKF